MDHVRLGGEAGSPCSVLFGVERPSHKAFLLPPPALRGPAATVSMGSAHTPAGFQITAKELISPNLFILSRDVDRKSVNSSQWQLHGFCIINYLYGARHSNYHPDEYDILIRQALILIALQHLTVSAGLA